MKRKSAPFGFTLIEMLTVIGIIGILASMLFPVVTRVMKTVKETQAKTEMKGIEMALKSYFNEYGRYPTNLSTGGDVSYGAISGATFTNGVLLNVLRSTNGPGNEAFASNPRKLSFLEVNAKSLQGTCYIDPWGQQYEIVVDADYDNICTLPAGSPVSSVAGRNVVIWSKGADKQTGTSVTTKDDLKSWE